MTRKRWKAIDRIIAPSAKSKAEWIFLALAAPLIWPGSLIFALMGLGVSFNPISLISSYFAATASVAVCFCFCPLRYWTSQDFD